jgi:hypothetical protein
MSATFDLAEYSIDRILNMSVDEIDQMWQRWKHQQQNFQLNAQAKPWVPAAKMRRVTWNDQATISGYALDEVGVVEWSQPETVRLGSIPGMLHPGRPTAPPSYARVCANPIVLWEIRPDLRPESAAKRARLLESLFT